MRFITYYLEKNVKCQQYYFFQLPLIYRELVTARNIQTAQEELYQDERNGAISICMK